MICTLCVQTYPENSACPNHPEEPLLDTRTEGVRDALRAMDDEARDRSAQNYSIGFVSLGVMGLGSAAAILFSVAPEVFGWLVEDSTYYVGGAIVTGVLVAFANLGRRTMRRRFVPRFGKWTGEQGFDPSVEVDAQQTDLSF